MPDAPTIQTIVGDVVGSTGHRYAVTDSAGHPMDTVKIIAHPAGGYLAIYHTGDEVHLATGTDLLTWTFRRTLDPQATQPTIQAMPTGGFLTAVEFNDQAGSGGRVRLRHYPHLGALLDGDHDHTRTVDRTLSACNEGTPNITAVSLSSDIDHSVIDLGFHYHRNCDVDRQARGTLTDFTHWRTGTDRSADHALISAAATQGQVVRGNIGDRDTLEFDGVRYTVHEVQFRKNDFGSWRVFLRHSQTGAAAYLPITTHRGSTAFANPTATHLAGPSGSPALVVTMFLPTEGAAPGEGGQLIYYREYENRSGSGSLTGRWDAAAGS